MKGKADLFAKIVIFYLAVAGYNAQDSCDTNPCPEVTDCIDAGNIYACVCDDGSEYSFTTGCGVGCISTPCQNGGSCLEKLDGSYTCECTEDYAGTNCQTVSSCSPDPCLNGGFCIGTSDILCLCPEGYTGTMCEIFNPCEINPCENDGTCFRSDSDLNNYMCLCADPYIGENCENLDFCSLTSCNNGGTCLNNDVGSTCFCNDRFTGTNCDTVLIFACEYFAVECLNDGTCLSSNTDPDAYICACATEFSGNNCETRIVYPCDSNPCTNGGTCQNDGADDEFLCICTNDYTDEDCSTRINHCETNSCQNGATCQDVGSAMGNYICNCPLGYTGIFCQETENPCESNPCQNQGTCHNWVTHYTCVCPPAYNDGNNCHDLVDGCALSPCSVGAISCVNQGSGDYSCVCQTGYTGNNCDMDIDECGSNPCENEGSCMDGVNGFICICKDGYSGAVCEIAGGCGNSDFIIEGCNSKEIRSLNYPDNYPEESLTCSWTITTDQVDGTIRILLEDFETEGIHDILEICDWTSGTVSNCVALDGKREPTYVFYSLGQTISMTFTTDSTKVSRGFKIEAQAACMPHTPPCLSNPCKNGGTCENLSSDSGEDEEFFCTCTVSYFGDMCQNDYEERCDPDPCIHGECKTIIVDDKNDYSCDCADGYSGTTCDIELCPIEWCLYSGLCEIIEGNRVCSCMEGYKGDRCEFVPCDIGFCNDHGDCMIDDAGQKNCSCHSNWAGQTCDIDVNGFCNSYECMNGGTCIFDEINSSPACDCPMYYSGDICENNLNPCSNELTPCKNSGGCITEPDGTASCACVDGWAGNTCEDWEGDGEQPTATSSGGNEALASSSLDNLALDWWWIALICLVGVLLVIFGCIFICTRNLQRSESKQNLTDKF